MFPNEEVFRELREAEHEVINHAVNARLGTSINVKEGDYSQDLSSREMQDHPDLIPTLRELLGQVKHPTHIEWLVRCLPVHKVFDASFLEDEFHRIEYASTLDGWGDTIWRSKMRGVENLIRRVLEDPEIEQRQKMFFVLAATKAAGTTRRDLLGLKPWAGICEARRRA